MASTNRRVRHKTCVICAEDLPIGRFPTRAHLGATQPNHNVCKSCWQQHLQNEVATQNWDEVRCPECPSLLTAENLERLASQEVYLEWLDKAAAGAAQTDEDWRACPSAACNSYQLHFDGNIFRCQRCGYRYCTECEVPMHDDETCDQYRARVAIAGEHEGLSALYVARHAKQCPGCRSNVVKISGCDHMNCTRCGHEFCWACLAPYEAIRRQGNGAHADRCPYSTVMLHNRLMLHNARILEDQRMLQENRMLDDDDDDDDEDDLDSEISSEGDY